MDQLELKFKEFPELSFVTRQITSDFTGVKIKDIEYDAYALAELLEDLKDTTPIGPSLNFSRELEEIFIDLEIVKRTTGGSCCKGRRYKEFYEYYNELLDRYEVQDEPYEESPPA